MRAAPLFALFCGAALAGSGLMPKSGPSGSEVSRGASAMVQPGAAPVPAPSRRGVLLPGPFPADLVSVIDGDTIEVRVMTWIDQDTRVRVRLRGIDAAELSSDCAEERAFAVEARAAMDGFLGQGRLLIADVGRDKYAGRVVARVLTADGADVGARMLAAGYAIAYDGGRRQPWCEVQLTAQR